MREPLEFTAEEQAEDERFFRWYGDWAPFDPAEVAAFMRGFDRPWWLVGGWSIEAFTGVPREHEDVDLSILACDITAFRAHVGDDLVPVEQRRGHAATARRPVPGGARRPEPDLGPEVRARAVGDRPADHARPSTGCGPTSGTPTTSSRVDEATWVAEDGIRYLRPRDQPALQGHARTVPRTIATSRVTWPLLDGAASGRGCATRSGGCTPDHPWLELLDVGTHR